MEHGILTSGLDTRSGVGLEPMGRAEVLLAMAGRRRTWTLEQKLSMVAQMERCGNIAAFVRSRLAANLKSLRKARGWSQEALAEEAGLDRTDISGIERKVKNPTVTVVERIAEALGCSLGALLD